MISMISGNYIEELGTYLIIELSAGKIKRIGFSSNPPDCPSELAAGLIQNLQGGPYQELDLESDLDLSGLTDFQRRVYTAVQKIPRGETRTYGQVAAALGMPGAARAVGGALRKNPFVLVVPCHRVVSAKGLGGFSSGVDLKKRLLQMEQSGRRSGEKKQI